MEHECFEDEAVAGFMNENFVAVKVDREERPDVDQVYMNAVQLITGSGGWPLNVICLPDGRPVLRWHLFPETEVAGNAGTGPGLCTENPGEAEQQAKSLTEGIRSGDLIHENKEAAEFTMDDLALIFSNWKRGIDFINGGLNRAPKFPLPVSYEFLLQYHFLSGDADALAAVTTTLDKWLRAGYMTSLEGDSPVIRRMLTGKFRILRKCYMTMHSWLAFTQKHSRRPGIRNIKRWFMKRSGLLKGN